VRQRELGEAGRAAQPAAQRGDRVVRQHQGVELAAAVQACWLRGGGGRWWAGRDSQRVGGRPPLPASRPPSPAPLRPSLPPHTTRRTSHQCELVVVQDQRPQRAQPSHRQLAGQLVSAQVQHL
jgi:hypothetical protein